MNGFLQDGEGNKSSSRLTMTASIFGVLIIWGVVCVKTSTMVDIPWGVIAFVVAVITGKGVNSAIVEAKPPNDTRLDRIPPKSASEDR